MRIFAITGKSRIDTAVNNVAVKTLFKKYMSQLEDLGFGKTGIIDVFQVFEDGILQSQIDDARMSDLWQPESVDGAAVIKRDVLNFAIQIEGKIVELTKNHTVVLLPMQNPAAVAESLESIPHELAHVYEPAHDYAKVRGENDGVVNGLKSWKEARAFLLEYFLTGNTFIASGITTGTNIESPTIARLTDAAPRFEEHEVGQLAAHLIFRLSKGKPKYWLISMIKEIDEFLSPKFRPKLPVNIKLLIDPLAYPITPFEENTPERFRAIMTSAEINKRKGKMKAIEQIFSAVVLAAERVGVTAADMQLARELILGFDLELNL